MEDNKLGLKCTNCDGSDFYLQDGFYFCEECAFQYENLFEMENEWNLNCNHETVKLAKDKPTKHKALRLTSFEEYNHILIRLVDEILNIENIPDFKATCLQLWISYLRQSDSVFFDKEQTTAPKLFTVYRRADAEILYNKAAKKRKAEKRKIQINPTLETYKQRRKRMRSSEKIISSQLSESSKSESFNSSMLANLSMDSIISEHEELELEIEFSKVGKSARKDGFKIEDGEGKTKTDKTSLFKSLKKSERPQVLNGSTLLSIIYCALNICRSKIQLGDLIRFVKEGHISYYKCNQLLPEELIENDVELSYKQHHTYNIVNFETFRMQLSYFTKLIPDLSSSFRTPSLIELVGRYLKEMQLPEDLKDYIERLMIVFPCEMRFSETSMIPNYEGRAMAFIIFTLKLLFGLDGYREEEMSRSTKKINETIEELGLETKIFAYKDWMTFIEYRQLILGKFYHPVLFHHTKSVEKPYVAFNSMLDFLHPKSRKSEGKMGSRRNAPRLQSKANAQEMLRHLIQNHEGAGESKLMNFYTFPCSLTPLTDIFQHILSHDTNFEINRSITMADYTKDSCEAFLKPQTFVNTFKRYGIELKARKSTFPKSFVFMKAAPAYQTMPKNAYKLSHVGITEREWRDELRRRHKVEKKHDSKDLKAFHERRMAWVQADRKRWQKQIRIKKYMRKMAHKNSAEASENEINEPRYFAEPCIFSDSENDCDDGEVTEDEIEFGKTSEDELETIFKSHARAQSDKSLTLVVPDYNLWHRRFSVTEFSPKMNEAEMEKLPKNFLWLLNFAGSLLHQLPLTLYAQVLAIEHQFVDVYQPVELFDNAIILKTTQYGPKVTPKRW